MSVTGRVTVQAIRHRLDCRRVERSTHPLIKSIRQLIRRIPDSERDEFEELLVWLDEMRVWRRSCHTVRVHARDRSLDQGIRLLRREYIDATDPRDAEILAKLPKLRTKKEFDDLLMHEILRLEEYLYVHEQDGKARGLVHFQYYYKYRLAFVSYAIVAKDKSRSSSTPIGNRPGPLKVLGFYGLLRPLWVCHPECEGIVMEVDPEEQEVVRVASEELVRAAAQTRRRFKKRSVLYRRFRMTFPGLKRISVDYLQPKSLDGSRSELPLWLLFAPLKGKRKTITKEQLKTILDCVYLYVYRDELDNIEDFNADDYLRYSTYLAKLRGSILEGVPKRITLI